MSHSRRSFVSPAKALTLLATAAFVASSFVAPLSAHAMQDGREKIGRYFQLDAKLEEALPDYRKLRDKATLDKAKTEALPIARDLYSVLNELRTFKLDSGLTIWDYRPVEIRSLLYVLGDEDTIKKVDEVAKSEKPEEADAKLEAECVLLAVEYFRATKDDGRTKAFDALAKLAERRGDRHELTGAASFMLATTESPAFEERILDLVRRRLTNTTAVQVALRYEAPRKLRNAIGKPLTFNYSSIDGKPVRGSDYAGKVLVIHFFATHHERSLREVNKMARIQIMNRSKGLELVSVSCDRQRSAVTLWMADFKRATWPILFDEFTAESSGAWHPLTLQLGVSKLPTTLLVDRKGVLRYANPENVDAKVKELLEEK